MTLGQFSVILGAADGKFHPVDSAVGVLVGAVVFFTLHPYLVRKQKPIFKPEKLRRKLGASIGEFTDVPPSDLDRLLTTAASHVFYAWNTSWQVRAFMVSVFAGNAIFYDYTRSIGWPYYLRFGLGVTVVFVVGGIFSIFSKPLYRRMLLRQIRHLRAAPVVSA